MSSALFGMIQNANVQRSTFNVQRPTSNCENAQAKKRSGDSNGLGLAYAGGRNAPSSRAR